MRNRQTVASPRDRNEGGGDRLRAHQNAIEHSQEIETRKLATRKNDIAQKAAHESSPRMDD
jgi:hypothetical protein